MRLDLGQIVGIEGGTYSNNAVSYKRGGRRNRVVLGFERQQIADLSSLVVPMVRNGCVATDDLYEPGIAAGEIVGSQVVYGRRRAHRPKALSISC